jgi:SAM-dependent methyltransferase
VIELRAADPQQRAMLESYTAELALQPGSRVLEIGCGTGAITRFLASLPGADTVVGLDPSSVFVERARELADKEALEYRTGDGRELAFEDASFDAVVCHTTLCHVPGCERVLAEAHRVIRAGGSLAVFDGDYATTTVATSDADPLQVAAEAAIAALVHDPWLMRRILGMLSAAGFDPAPLTGHSYIQTNDPDYMLTIIDRGADALLAGGTASEATAAALKAEARERIASNRFFGHISYASTIARRR